MRDSGTSPTTASAAREMAYPLEAVWQAIATLPPYCPVCDVSAIVDSRAELGIGTEFRAFPGKIATPSEAGDDAADGMPGEIIDWSPQRSVATRLETGSETVVVRVEMAEATPDTTLVTISVEVAPLQRSRLVAAMSRSSYARMARRTVEGEIGKLPAHLALLDDRQAGRG